MKHTDIQQELATGKIFPLLIRLSLPVTLAQFVHVLYNIVDRMFIGRMPGIGVGALSSLSFTMPVLLIISAFSSLIGMGGAPLLSIYLGEKKYKAAARLQGTSMTLLVAVGILLTIVFGIFCDPILLRFGASADTLQYASDYLHIYLLGSVFMMVSVGMNSFLNAQGRTVEGVIAISAGAVANILLDPIFIYQFDWGISGAALASVISQGISAIWTTWLLFFSKQLTVRLSVRDLRVSWANTVSICKLGISSFIFDINESVITILLNLLIRHYSTSLAMGDLYIGAMTIINSLLQVFFMPLKGITRGAQPIIGYCVGARNYTRLADTVRYARICSISCAVAIWAVITLFPEPLARIFSNDEQLVSLSASLSRTFFCTIFVLGLQMVNQHSFIAMANAKLSFFFGILRKILILIPLAVALPIFFGISGVFLAEPVSNVLTVIITHIVFTRYMKQLKIQFEQACPS